MKRPCGVELIFDSESSPVVNSDFIDLLKKKKLNRWCNAIKINDQDVLSAGHDDVVSIFTPENGWGWLIKRGFNIIQTDWPMLLKSYVS